MMHIPQPAAYRQDSPSSASGEDKLKKAQVQLGNTTVPHPSKHFVSSAGIIVWGSITGLESARTRKMNLDDTLSWQR